MASRVPYPKRGFIEFKCSMLFPFRKIAIASKKYQPAGKHGSRAVRNSVTSLTINTNLIINYKKKKNQGSSFGFPGVGLCLVPPIYTKSQTLLHFQTSEAARVCWSLHSGLCHSLNGNYLQV